MLFPQPKFGGKIIDIVSGDIGSLEHLNSKLHL
ncbi:hypothetical protein Pint_10967 [Pistacia integerrima]|uniref:Uncharacterized protein n=1 Tax=Pistacia integerrima TaxID=434235 RepID=A0ACC0XKW3_9ROSI|nr:hypothetical protein Pint_10967 [Pistacia integerrima]